MRIALALQLPVLQQGGLEVLVRTLITEAHPDDEIFLISQDTPEALKASELQDRLSGHLQVPTEQISSAWNLKLSAWLKKRDIDICHFHLVGTYGWGASSPWGCPINTVSNHGIPTVTTNHSAMDFFNQTRASQPLWRKLAAAAKVWPGKARQLRSVRWEVSVSKHDLVLAHRYFPSFRTKLVQVYHSRLNAELPVLQGAGNHSVLNVGTIAFHKGQHILTEAFARIAGDFPEWQLNLVGYFAEKACVERIHSLIKERRLQNRVHLIGQDPEPTHFFEDTGIYVQPSLVEGLGLSLQEAMFHGRACVGSAIGGIPELILDPTMGLQFPGGDVAALASALARLMGDPEKRSRLGAAARASILERGMTRQAMSTTYRALYQQALQMP